MRKNIVFFIIGLLILNGFILVPIQTQGTLKDNRFDFIIITPADFENELQPLISHKENYGIVTKIVTLDDIYNSNYFPAYGRDDAEKIKYFIKDAIENWETSYILLVGGKEELPSRYVDICSWDEHYQCFSDLYYADIYDANGSFSSWDSNNDDIFAGQSMDGMVDTVDLHPDVAIGRILCKDDIEVHIIVDKIIHYETITSQDKSWFNNIVLCGGDDPSSRFGLREGEMYEEWFNRSAQTAWEGEYLCDAISDILSNFTSIKIYATGLFRSDCSFLTVDNINKAINKGAGFLVFVGHGRQDRAIKTNFPLLNMLWLPFPSGYYSSDISGLYNYNRLPITIFAGCYCADFDTTSSPVAWDFVKHENGGAIASFAATTGSQMIGSTLVTDTYMGLLILDTFRYYVNGTNIIGDIWRNIIDAYLLNEDAWSLGDAFSEFNWWHTNANPMVLEEWILIGDPTLKVGGYR